MNRLLGLTAGILCFHAATSQDIGQDIELEQFIENLFQMQDTDIDYDDLYESLYLLYTNPINLNTADAEMLASLFVLNQRQIFSLLDYIQTNGRLISIYELQAIPYFDLQTISNIRPFVTIRDDDTPDSGRSLVQRVLSEDNNYFIYRHQRILEQQRGYLPAQDSTLGNSSSRYLGSPDKYLARFRVSHRNDFSIGFTVEKDAGETAFSRKASSGFDYQSFHVMLQEKGNWKSVVIGDYQVQVGQGLIFGAGYNPGKGAETITTVRRGTTGIRPYNSVLESGFYRGAAATYRWKNIEISTYISRLRQDARLQSDTTFSAFDEFVSSIQNTGLHRTASEISAKDRVSEMNTGATVSYSKEHRRYLFGGSVLRTSFTQPILRKPTNYNQFEFKGTENIVYGLFASYLWQNFNLFGEIARSNSGGMGMVAGFMTSLSSKLDLSMLVRNYEKDFHSFYGNGFGEGSRLINERGMYWGLKYKLSQKVFFSAYFDKFRFPWLRYRVDAPSEGHEYLVRLSYTPTRDVNIYFQMRQQAKDATVSDDDAPINIVAEGIKHNFLLNFDFSVNRHVNLKSRVQYSNYQLSGQFTEGIALIQDLNITYGKFKLSTRLALFDTDDYENRQYVYERDVLLAFSIPAYSGLGKRSYALLQYKVNRQISLWARFARFSYRNVEDVGSGLDQIQGNTKSEIKFQIRLKF